MNTPLRQSRLNHVLGELGATFGVYHDWNVATSFSTPEAEAEVLKTGVGLADVSWLGKLDVKGREEELAALRLDTGAAWNLARGHLLVTCDPEHKDAVVQAAARHITQIEESYSTNATEQDDDTARRSSIRSEPDAGPSVHGSTSSPRTEDAVDAGSVGAGNGKTTETMPCLHVVDVTSVYAGLLLAGPHSREVLQRMAAPDVSDSALPNGKCISAKVAGLHTRLLREDLHGILAYALLVGTEYAEYAWDSVLHAGRQFGIMPVGSEAVQMVRRGDR